MDQLGSIDEFDFYVTHLWVLSDNILFKQVA